MRVWFATALTGLVRSVAVVLFVFGSGIASMSLGTGVVADRFGDAPDDAPNAGSTADGESTLADD
jgi:hypothetical protein